MHFQTPGSVAVVTGGASGLGRAVVNGFFRAGMTVVLADPPDSAGPQLAAALGERAHFLAADITDPRSSAATVSFAGAIGPVRAAVNCAGVATPGRILGRDGLLPVDAFRRVVEINLVGTFVVLGHAAKAMTRNEPVDGPFPSIPDTSSPNRDACVRNT